MLRKFITGQKFVTTEILKALESNDWDTAERFAHTLKGVSGNIGATGLQQLAEKLEVAIKAQQPRNAVNGRLGELEKQLDYFIAQLEQKLPKEPGKSAITVNPEKLKEVCDKLKFLLADDDAEASDVMDANADLLNAAFPNHYRKIDEDIRSFNFEAALTALNAATGTSA
jgi:two-component system sensor histidine kinase/response regulator